ncbi:MAG: hypothetical protein HY062_15030 [Bacteroidetes bacterium]|nr:hypothetical protein [Bacteroidota bacterium]
MKLVLRISILLLFAFNTANAQHDHSSHDHNAGSEHSHKTEPPHGGEIKDLGKYHLEIVFDVAASTEKMSVYVLKSNLKSIDSKNFKGIISLKYKNGTEENYELINNNSDKLFCDIKDVVNGFNAIIKISIKEKEYSCTYNYKGMK